MTSSLILLVLVALEKGAVPLFPVKGVRPLFIQGTPQAAPEAASINRAKGAIVREIEGALPSVPFETWLRGLVGAQAEMKWEVNDCGEQAGTAADRGRDFPLCAEVQVGLTGNRRLSLSLLVGSMGRGLTLGPLMFYQGNIAGPVGAAMISIKKLSDVPTLLGKPN